MKQYWYRVVFENGVIDWVRAFNTEEAKIKAQAEAINNGKDYTVKNVVAYVIDSQAYKAMEKDNFCFYL